MNASNHHTNKAKLANSILKELISTTNINQNNWVRECDESSEARTEINYSTKSELCPESKIYFKADVVKDSCCPYWPGPGEIELSVGISNDCTKHSLVRKGVQRIHKKPYSQELEGILSNSDFTGILSKYDFNPRPFDYIDRSKRGEEITYVGVFSNKRVCRILGI